MFSFGNCPIVEDFIEMVTHEIGHTLSLQDAFKDALLGKPAKGSTKDNYMDYKIRDRKRFYRTQWELVLNYTFVNPSPQ